MASTPLAGAAVIGVDLGAEVRGRPLRERRRFHYSSARSSAARPRISEGVMLEKPKLLP